MINGNKVASFFWHVFFLVLLLLSTSSGAGLKRKHDRTSDRSYETHGLSSRVATLPMPAITHVLTYLDPLVLADAEGISAIVKTYRLAHRGAYAELANSHRAIEALITRHYPYLANQLKPVSAWPNKEGCKPCYAITLNSGRTPIKLVLTTRANGVAGNIEMS